MRESEGKDEGCLPSVMALVAWMVLVESVDGVTGEEAAGGSDKGVGMREREKKMQRMMNVCEAA